MRAGELQQVGTPQDLYDQPANIFVAGFLGSPAMNIFRTQMRRTDSGTFAINFGKQSLEVAATNASRYSQIEQYLNQPILAGLRPEAFSVAEASMSNSNSNLIQSNLIQVEVSTLEALGHEMIVYCEVPIEKIEIEDSLSDVSIGNQASHDQQKQHHSILTARVPSSRQIEALQPLTLRVDTSNLYLFTSNGDRIK
jgi:multiple sugar transport system ATP-binding protein